jgi:outer membrane protein assembly factor BamB
VIDMNRRIVAVLLLALAITSPIAARRRAVSMSAFALYRGDAARGGTSAERGPVTLQHLRWQRPLDGPVRGLVYYGGVVYAGGGGAMWALDAATGEPRWSFAVADRQFAPAAIQDAVVYTCARSTFYALDRSTGALLWTFEADASIGSTSPLLLDGVAYVGSDNGTIYAIDLTTHTARWSVTTGGGVRTYLAGANDTIYATQGGGVLCALAVSDGHELWRARLAGDADWTEAAVANGLVFAGASGNDFYAFDATTGVQRWKFDDANSDRSGWSAPAIADGVVYAGNRNRRMFAFEAATGRVLWRVDTEDAATTDPVLVGNTLYFGVGSHGASNDVAPRDFYAIDVTSGLVTSRFRAAGLVLGGAAVGDGTVFYQSLARMLYAVE